MGVNNFVETIMSLRAIEIKKNLQTIAREYQQRNMLFRLQTFMIGETYDFFFSKNGNLRTLFKNINQYAIKLLKLKDAKIWFKDMLNNYIWAINQNNQEEIVDLT